jgi:putative BNR repeat neuraminidase
MWGRGGYLIVAVGATLAIAMPGMGRARERGANRRSEPPTASLGTWGPGSWCWFADPRAVRISSPDDVTFVGWITPTGKITVGSYDEVSGVTRTSVVGTLFHDDHSSPSLLVEPDKRVTVFWSGHNGRRLHYRTTLAPESILAWGPVMTVPARVGGRMGFTYPDPVMLSGERDRLYLFWRGASWATDGTTRGPAGSWAPARNLIVSPKQRPYVKVDSNGRDTIAFAFTNGHPRNTLTSIYYMAYRRGWLHHADGRLIAPMEGRAVRPDEADVVYDASRTRIPAWVWDVDIDGSGDPVVVYATFPSANRHLYWYARWTGSVWVSHFLTEGGPTISPGGLETEYSGGLALDHGDPGVVYLSRKVDGWFEIERWRTSDGGANWRHATIVRTPGADDVRPVVVRGSDGGPMSLLWLSGHYGSYTDYHTAVDYLR